MSLHVEVKLDVARPAAEVFDFACTRYFENLRHWRPELVEVTPLDDGPMQVGLRAVEVRRTKRGPPQAPRTPVGRTLQVTEYLPPAVFAFSGLDDHPLREGYKSRMTFQPLGPLTRVVWTLDQDLTNPLLSVWPGPIFKLRLRWDLARSLRLLRDALERGP